MSNRILAALTLALAMAGDMAGDPALADLRHAEALPAFSASEQAIIHRNAALSALVGTDPWLVRRVLDAITVAGASRSGGDAERTPPRQYERPPEPARNPDLDYLGRSSPEAAHDLFQLIKRASENKGGTRR